MLNRRDALGVSVVGVAAAWLSGTTEAAGPAVDSAQSIAQTGFTFAAPAESNPLAVKIIAFNTVSPDVDASIRFYRDVIGMKLADEGALSGEFSGVPGIGKAGRRYATLTMPESPRSAAVRVFAAPPGAAPNRPRPNSGPMDPGLLIMEGGTRDPAESYHKLASANTPVITPPRYYFYRNTVIGRDIDVMSYAAFGPGGEQMFITANVRSDRPQWTLPGIHSGFANAAITSLDQRPVDAFYSQALGLKRVTQVESHQKNNNALIDAPPDSYHVWGSVGADVSMEVWQFNAATGTMYPTSMDRTGLAMMTMRVNDLAKCRLMCKEAGIRMLGESGLPMPGKPHQDGFVIRGAVGELIEVVAA
jgi:catechol 2,3-dioxygenase-like lactoylglutathione lyase family enzyme